MKVKLLLLLSIFQIIQKTESGDCPVKMDKFLHKQVNSYFKKNKVKGKISKFRCNYDHDYNIFNMSHKVKGSLLFKKKKVRFNVNFVSGLANVFDYSKLDFKFCHQKFPKKKLKTRKALLKSLGKYFKHIDIKDIKKSNSGDMKCLRIKKNKTWRKLKKIL